MRRQVETVAALMDCSYVPPGCDDIVYRVEEIEIPIATSTNDCAHDDTVCAECVWSWRIDHLFVERLPWERANPTPPENEP
jgi:hypothetical protein